MRILFIAPLPEPTSGQSLASKVLLDALQERHEVDVVDMSRPDLAQGVSLPYAVQILRNLGRIWRKKGAADVIYLTISESRISNMRDLLIYVICASRLDRLLIHLHGGAGMRELLADRGSIVSRLNGIFLRRLGGVVVLGERHLPIFEGLVARERLHIVPNFALNELFTTPEAIERKFSATDPLRVLFLSNLVPGKGHLELVEAFGLLAPAEQQRLRIDFAGGFDSEASREAFRSMIAQFPQLAYHGTVRGGTKIALCQAAHVFCLPTYFPYEGQPISLLEGYASGAAAITTDHSGIFDVFADGANGYAVEKRSAASLAEALRRVLGNPEEVRRMALANLMSAQTCYRAANYNARLIELLEDLGRSAQGREPKRSGAGMSARSAEHG